MTKLNKEIVNNIKILVLALVCGLGMSVAYGWDSPPSNPPACSNPNMPGCSTPLNVGSTGQFKQGGITVGAGLSGGGLGFSVLNGNAGIGTSEPSQMLDVVGYSKSRTGFCINNSCITAWPWSTSGGNVIQLPSGTVLAFNLSSCPSGWSPFTDAAGRVILGVGESNATGHTPHTLGQKSGAEAHKQTLSELAPHSHGISGSSQGWLKGSSVPTLSHCSTSGQGGSNCGSTNVKNGYNTVNSPSLSASGSADPAPMNIMNPYVALLYCSKN